jgi:peptidylprolyl isomerase
MKNAVAVLSLCGAVAAGPALADALEGKKSGAEILAATAEEDWREIPADDLLVIELERGKVYVALSPALAPRHVAQVKKLAREGFYDGLSFYRVIDGFVAQGGDPFGEKKTKTSKKVLKAEFEGEIAKGYAFNALKDADGFAPSVGFIASQPAGYDAGAGAAWHLHCAGAFAFGREDGRDTASTEFYIALQPQRYLDRNMSVFGRVIDGMQHLQALRRVEPPTAKTDDPGETIVSIRISADIPAADRTTFEILDSAAPVFMEFAEARRNRPEAFFHFRPDFLDVCQFPVPVRTKSGNEE